MTVGRNFSLNCSLNVLSRDQSAKFEWFNDLTETSTHLAICNDSFFNIGNDVKNSYLQITSVRENLTGNYTCRVTVGNTILNKNFTVNATGVKQ